MIQEKIVISRKTIKDDVVKKSKLIDVSIKQIKNDYEELLKEVIEKSITGDHSTEDVTRVLNVRKEIEVLNKSSERLLEGIVSENSTKKRICETDKNKIYFYHKTGDFTQSEIADIFGTTQTTVSRILKNIEEEK